MTQIRKFALILLAAFALLGVLSVVPAGQTAQPEIQTQMRAIELPEPEFIAEVMGYGAGFGALEAERLGNIAEIVCGDLEFGFSYMEIRDALVSAYGFRTGEAGLLISAAQRHICS